MQIAYLDGPRLRRALIAGCDHARLRRAELNRINVFPVPDGDTGSNLALTARCIADRLRASRDRSVAAVAEAAADAATRAATRDFAELVERVLDRARESLARTPDPLPALRTAGVVDAGAKGFGYLVEGVAALIRGGPIASPTDPPAEADAVAVAAHPVASAECNRFCTEALVRGDALPDATSVRMALHGLGDSLVAIRGANVLKVHIHTDEPEAVFDDLRRMGALVAHKAEDMAAQRAAVGRAAAAHVRLARRPRSSTRLHTPPRTARPCSRSCSHRRCPARTHRGPSRPGSSKLSRSIWSARAALR